jgi:DNA-binding CsgD family transcriptional regulator/tetratricopeptide (TPR) repeat protein
MKLLEREDYLNTMNSIFNGIAGSGGHTLFIAGEAGIGKTSLVREFTNQIEKKIRILSGGCDALFTPRPLGPLFDISANLSPEFQRILKTNTNRSSLFNAFLDELKGNNQTTLLIFEDVHWADEATLDLIKYFSRRVNLINCLFVVTYRDDDTDRDLRIRTIMGEIPARQQTRMKIHRLSIDSVKSMAKNSHLKAEDVYRLTQGNPFYITEILAHYSPGIPENIKDSILSVFYAQPERVRNLWEVISTLSGKIDIKLLELIIPNLYTEIEQCLKSGVLHMEEHHLTFKHELYRKTIEEALTAYKRIHLNARVLAVLLASAEGERDLALIVHHAKNAHNKPVVAEFAPIAARDAAMHGAHCEAAKLYMTAIQYSDSREKAVADLYEQYAYECYLTNQVSQAIDSQLKALSIWRDLDEKTRVGASLRLLSRFYWFKGIREDAEKYGLEAISELEKESHPQELAKAYSNYAQLKMLSSEREKALEYGQKAIELANKIHDEEILCHALNNIGSALFESEGTIPKQLHQSLEIALKNGYQEHVARAYTNLSSNAIEHKLYDDAEKNLELGIAYCSQRDLDSWTYYMLSLKARLHFDKCELAEAEAIARNIVEYPEHPAVIRIGSLVILGRLLIRKGDFSGFSFLDEARQLALITKELQRIIPVAIGLLEYGWIINDHDAARQVVDIVLDTLDKNFISHFYSELAVWLHRNKYKTRHSMKISEPWSLIISGDWQKAARQFKLMGCPYEYALALFDGPEDSQREALTLLDQLGAQGTLELLKSKLRSKGIRNIPRGPRASTRSNSANLTSRQIDVLFLLKEGLPNAEIANRLFISAKTADHHISAILSKLNVHSRMMAIREAEKLGIL